jgi:5'(3')-deoxyribonucleotidase
MRIAIDYDGTIADTNRAKARWILQNLGQVVPPWDCDRTSCVPIIGESAYEKMGDVVYERESTLQTEEVAGASRAIRVLAETAEIYVVTARPPARMAFTREWFTMRGLEGLVREFQSSQSTTKEAVCRTVGADVLIDDDLRHLRDVRLPGLKRILFEHGREDSTTVPEVITCRSWSEVLVFLNAI